MVSLVYNRRKCRCDCYPLLILLSHEWLSRLHNYQPLLQEVVYELSYWWSLIDKILTPWSLFLGCWPFALPFTSSLPLLYAFLLIQSRLALAQCSGTRARWCCSPVGRQTTYYRLEADRDRVGYAHWEKWVQKRGRWRVPKGVEVKHAKALICNSNEGH